MYVAKELRTSIAMNYFSLGKSQNISFMNKTTVKVVFFPKLYHYQLVIFMHE